MAVFPLSYSVVEAFVSEYQCGFRKGRSTTDQMFTLRQIFDKVRKYNLQTHHLLIAFKATYDPFERKDLWKIMIEHGFPEKLTSATLDAAKTSVRIADQTLSVCRICRSICWQEEPSPKELAQDQA